MMFTGKYLPFFQRIRRKIWSLFNVDSAGFKDLIESIESAIVLVAKKLIENSQLPYYNLADHKILQMLLND
jgi:hypothetical protein